ncbi:ADP-ribosylation factor-binding protein GGA2 isoform X1 [Drosophila guanche]|uniref:Blast:Protein LST8 homolog n=1 Tax=Drosophila guanche TaxID=7266 RepID=A0A3B0KRH4_DROGU|nr:ADP-ribosylation factor-binding protein GGA2 isoform X1 [Drosophila guanche]SPP86518.1 blast:Protein LST8 homolog [Drosophila guanche]
MTTDESIMEEMLDRATNPAKERVDELGVQMFCIVVRSHVHLVHKAQEMIVAKVRSANVTEATRAISLLEECMTQCGEEFQDEAGKFRFLNELIRLVSKKYKGSETPHEVKQRIMECLLLWTTEFPQRQKIRDAYDMLRNEGDIEHGQTEAAVAKRESVLGTIDEAMFAKLIKSNNQENFKRANLLLQYRMAQEARRNELLSQHRLELNEVLKTMELLNQMLDTYDPSNKDVSETITDLYIMCKKHKPIFQHMTQLLDDNDAQLLADTLDANGALLTTMQRYNQLVPSPTKNTAPGAAPAQSQTPTTTAATATSSSNELLINELLGDLLIGSLENGAEPAAAAGAKAKTCTASASASTSTSASAPATADPLADLSDIFSSALAESESKQSTEKAGSGLLKPEVLSQCTASDGLGNGSSCSSSSDSSRKPGTERKMPQIDVLSEELFQKILPSQERMSSFKRDPEKVTLNDMAKERMQIKAPEVAQTQTQTQPLAVAAAAAAELVDDVPLLSDAPLTVEQEPQQETAPQQTHLSDISIELDNVQATGEQRVVLDDDDMQLSLNFTSDRPGHRVSVIVISAQNKSRQPVRDFHFEASVKKPCKVRLLPPTESAMPPHKPFRPATPINQVMLLLNPTGKAVDVTCIVGYKLGDDPDPIKESIVAQNIAYVD